MNPDTISVISDQEDGVIDAELLDLQPFDPFSVGEISWMVLSSASVMVWIALGVVIIMER